MRLLQTCVWAVIALVALPFGVQAQSVTYVVQGAIEVSTEPLLPVGAAYDARLTFDPSTLTTSADPFGGVRYSAGTFSFETGTVVLSGAVSITIDSADDSIRIDNVGVLTGTFAAGVRINLLGAGLTSDAFPDPFPIDSDFSSRQIVINRSSSTTGSVTVFRPATAAELLSSLINTVLTLNVRAGIANSLDAKLQAVMAALDDANGGNSGSAINVLYAFLNAVEAQRGKSLSDAVADDLVLVAEQIIAVLSQS